MTPDPRGRGRKARPRDERRRDDRSFGRRNPPPEATGAQSGFLDALVKSGRTVVVTQQDGDPVRGSVVEHTDADIAVETEGGGIVRIRHADIRYLHRDEA